MNRSAYIVLIAACVGAALAVIGIAGSWLPLSIAGILGMMGSAVAGAMNARVAVESPARTPIQRPALRMPTAPTGSGASAALSALASDLGSFRLAAVSLWLEDPLTATVRHVDAVGEMRPDTEPVSGDANLLVRSLAEHVAQLEPIARVGHEPVTLSRFAVPVFGDSWRGVVAVDLLGDRIDRGELVAVVGSHRTSLVAALDMHHALQSAQAAQALVGAAAELFRLVDPGAVAQALLDRVMAAAHADVGSVMLFDPKDGRLHIAASEGLPRDVASSTSLSPGEGIAGWVYTTGKASVVEDLQTPSKPGRHGVKSAISVPLADRDGIVGVVNVGSRRFEARQAQLLIDALESLCGIGVVALRNAQVAENQSELQFSTLRALALALETKDPHARGVADRVHDLSIALGRSVGMSGTELESLRIASLLHDIGMADSVGAGLQSRRPLSTVEWGLVKTHPRVAKDLLAQSPSLSGAIPIVFNHHERFDGTGYMTGVAGDAIPIGARVLSVADAYVAMITTRPYRDAMTSAAALAELEEQSGAQFDPQVVAALRHLAAEGVLDALCAR